MTQTRPLKMLHRFLTLLLVVCLGLPHPSLFAQSGSLDLDPPDLVHTPVDNTSGATSEIIRLNASDQQGLKDISLYYRFSTDETYSTIPMQTTGSANAYEAIVRLPRAASTIYYYFEAVDVSGNRVLDGYPFSPYTRNIVFNETPAALDSSPAAPAAEQPVASDTSTAQTRKPWMWLLGLLVVGALVAGSSSGGSSSGDGGSDPTPSDPNSPTVPVNLTVPLP